MPKHVDEPLALREGALRLAAARAALAAARLDALIVSDPVALHYLSGFEREETFAVGVIAHEFAALVTVTMFALQAERLPCGFEAIIVEHGTWSTVKRILAERLCPGARVGFQSEHLTHSVYTALDDEFPFALVPSDELLAGIRQVKSQAELVLLREAAAAVDQSFRWLSEQRVVGRLESDVGWMLERHLREEFDAKLAFPCVVSCGAHGAIAHHTTARTPISRRELLIVDIGCVVEGYRSDATRMFATGPLSADRLAAYESVRRAHSDALAALRAGVRFESAHEAANRRLAADGYSELPHNVGHGIGLELHEEPFVEASGVLQAGEVLTVEPGVYLPGRFGVRVEDEALILRDGAQLLTSASRELITLG